MRNLVDDPLRLGILGCGSFVQRRILPALEDVASIKVVCLQKRDLTAARALSAQFNVPHAVSTRKDLLENPEVEAVFISTPNNLHEEDAIACAEAGKPTLCEKPLAPSVAAIINMMQTFQRHSVPLYVGHSLRFKPSIQKAKQLLQDDALGTLRHIRVHLAIPLAEGNWRLRKDQGGGVLQDIGVHLVDLIHFITGESITSTYATANPSWSKDSQEADRSVTALCRLSNGATAELLCSFEQPFYAGFEVVGSESRLVSLYSLRQTYDPLETLCHIQKDDSKLFFPLRASNVYVEEMNHFAASVTGPTPNAIPAEIGLAAIRVIEAFYESMHTGKEVRSQNGTAIPGNKIRCFS